MSKRFNKKNRQNNEIRHTTLEKGLMENAYSNVLIKSGNTKVLCTASVIEEVPPFAEESGMGWLSAEYNMLPGATLTRKRRQLLKQDGRSIEIQRLIGRSLRAAINLSMLSKYSILIDCDVIQADGGTRCASITGGFCALSLAIDRMLKENKINSNPIINNIASISAGKVKGEILLDLDYSEDKIADADFNVVMNDKGNFIEIQGTGERTDLTKEEVLVILDYCKGGIDNIFRIQKEFLSTQQQI